MMAAQASFSSPRVPAERWRKWAGLALWGLVIALGVRRRGSLGVLAVGYGIERVLRTLRGRPLWEPALPRVRQPDYRFGDGTRDWVDEASWESFPASDPPGRGVG